MSACWTCGCGRGAPITRKFVVLRHPGRPELDVAFVGGIDLCHSRNDGPDHLGDSQRQPMAAVYGDRPPWHDIQAAIRGPAVTDVEEVFRERWSDPTPLTRNPVDVISELIRHDSRSGGSLPPRLPTPAPRGKSAVQLLRTYPKPQTGLPLRSGWRAQRRARLRQGRRPSATPDLPGGPVLLVDGHRRSLRHRPAPQPAAAPDRRDPASPRPGRAVQRAAQPHRPIAGIEADPTSRRRPRRGVRDREPRRHAGLCARQGVRGGRRLGRCGFRTTSIAARGRTTPSCHVPCSTTSATAGSLRPSIGTAMVRARSRASCG